jgi:glycerol transport system ATP-binding protein
MVELAEISGSETYLHVKNGEQTIVGLLDMVRDFTAGEKVKLALDSGKMYAFGTDGALVSSPFGKGK